MHPEAYEFGAMIRSVTALGSDEKPRIPPQDMGICSLQYRGRCLFCLSFSENALARRRKRVK